MFGWTAQEKERLFKAQTRAAREELNLTEQVVELKRQITDLEIKKSKVEEDNARERRELTHMIGLEKRRQEAELVQGKKDAELTVREANLSADRTRFDEQMKFQMERFNKEVDYLHGMVGQMLERLPTITVDRTIGPAKEG